MDCSWSYTCLRISKNADSPRDALGRPVMLLHLVCRCSVSLVVLHCACQTCQACTTWSPAQGEIDVTCNAVSYSERGWPVQANPVGRRSSAVASPEVEVQLSFTKASVRCTAAKSLRECRMLPGVLAAVLASRNEGAPLSSAGNVVTPLRVHRGDSIQRRGDDARGPSSYYWNRLYRLAARQGIYYKFDAGFRRNVSVRRSFLWLYLVGVSVCAGTFSDLT